jgi:hypothetical protein
LNGLIEVEDLGSETDGAFSDSKEGIDGGDEFLVVCIADAFDLGFFVRCEARQRL